MAHQLRQENASRAITAINDEMGATLTDPLEINQRFHRFYLKLYTSESSDDDYVYDSFFGSITIPTIDADTAVTLENPFSNLSLQSGPCKMENTLVWMDICVSSLKITANELTPILLSVYEESYGSGSLSETMRLVVVSFDL